MKVLGYIKTDIAGKTPLIDIPLMTDEDWNRMAREDRKKNPQKYHDIALARLALPNLSEAEKKQWKRVLEETKEILKK